MRGRTHLLIGVGSTVVALWVLRAGGEGVDPVTAVLGVVAAAAGSLAPDLDHGGSTASRRIPRKLAFEAVGVLAPVFAGAALASTYVQPSWGAAIVEALGPVIRVGLWLLLPAALLVGLSVLVRAVSGHRGMTHSLAFASCAGVGASVLCAHAGLSWVIGACLGWGWVTHLLADALTGRGVPHLLWPLTARAGRNR